MATTATKSELVREAQALEKVEYLVRTNQGTYGVQEALQSVGASNPEFADRNVYETVGGRVRSTGPSEDQAPGHVRHLNREALSADRKRLAELRKRIANM